MLNINGDELDLLLDALSLWRNQLQHSAAGTYSAHLAAGTNVSRRIKRLEQRLTELKTKHAEAA